MRSLKPTLFFLILGLVASGILLVAADFGESSASLGQITDEFDTSDNISVIVNMERNTTLNAMELNYSAGSGIGIYNLTQLKEHDYFGATGNTQVTFSIANNDELRAVSTVASLGWSHIFLTVDRDWLNGLYVRFRYYPQSTAVNPVYQTHSFEVWDGDYDRSNATDFPVINWPASQPPPFKGNGSLFAYQNTDGLNGWFTKDFQIDTTNGTLSNCTLWFWFNDGWGGTGIGIYLDWIEINTGAGGTGNIMTINYNNSSPITMEVAGGENDYGFTLNPELPFNIAAYDSYGYFTTTDQLSGINGSVLAQLTNATIPSGTGITAEFSSDNSTWVNPTALSAGFQAIDLRDQNWSAAHFVRYNMSGTGTETPRLYQSRLITTEGVTGPGAPGQNVTGIWTYYNATGVITTVGTLDAGNLASLHSVDGDRYNVSEVAGAPGMLIYVNFTGIDDETESLWFTCYHLYDGNQVHKFDKEMWNFTGASWVEIGQFGDGTVFTFHNETVWEMRIPNDYLNGGEVRVRFDHEAAGNINHDLSLDYVKILGHVPSSVTPPASGAVTVIETDPAPWIAIAIILMCVAYLLLRPR